jgi:hypothetical protein
MVAELNEHRCCGIAAGFLEDVADPAIALLVGQDLVSVGRIVRACGISLAVEGERVAIDDDALDICLVAGLIVGAVFLEGLFAVFGLVSQDRVK